MLKVKILSSEKLHYEGLAKSVKLPGEDGSFAIFPLHSPIISSLVKGRVVLTDSKGDEKYFDIDGGCADLHEDNLDILIS
ncbi:MAG: FoF1 ATP synthase subunit delta/epsilon [Bacteroidales bacterium]